MLACKLSESIAFLGVTLLGLLMKKKRDENYFKMEYNMNSSSSQNTRYGSASFCRIPFLTGWV
jgi:hypothetical protein